MASNNNGYPNPLRPIGGSPLGGGMSSSPATQLPHLRPPPQPLPPSTSPFTAFFQPHSASQSLQAHLAAQSHNTMLPPGAAASSPGLSGGPKKPPQKPPARPTHPSSMAPTVQSFKSNELTPAAKRKKRKLPEKQLPDRVAALLPESALYTQLLEFEARLDAALARKKVDIQESLKNPPTLQKTLRIYVFNTFANQNRMGLDQKNVEPPSWSLKIIGRILEDGVDSNSTEALANPNHAYPKFSSFFKRVTVGLDPMLYSENPTIIWENVRSTAPVEGFEIKRKGDKEFTVNIRLEMNYSPEKFKLSPALMEVLGIEVDTRARIIAGIWHYVKAKKLQNPSDPSSFSCDPPLKKVFGDDKMKFSFVSLKISQHLSPPQAINLEHRIRLSGNCPAGHACYDVLIDIPFPLQKEMAAFLANTEKHKEIEACDEVICAAIKKIHEHRRRRAFFLGFSQSPVEFINALIASQSRDLKLVSGDASRNTEKERHADFYNQPWVEDAVIRYLNRKPAGGTDVPSNT